MVFAANGAGIFSTIHQEGSPDVVYPSDYSAYAGWFDGGVMVTRTLMGRFWAAADDTLPGQGGTGQGYQGVSFNAKTFDLDDVRFAVRDGLIVMVTNDAGKPKSESIDAYGRKWTW